MRLHGLGHDSVHMLLILTPVFAGSQLRGIFAAVGEEGRAEPIPTSSILRKE